MMTNVLPSFSWADLAAELERSERTIYRFLDALTACGVPWYFDKQQDTYRTREGFRLGNLIETSSQPRAQSQTQTQTQTHGSPEKAIDVVNEAHNLIEQLKSSVARLKSLSIGPPTLSYLLNIRNNRQSLPNRHRVSN